MADRSITVRIGANVTGLTAGLRTAQQAARDFTGKTLDGVQRNQAAISTLSRSVGVVGLGLTALAAVAVRSFANFDAAMSNVAATGDDARDSIDGLRAAALKAGADTVFSATEAAGAVENLAKAGVSAQDTLAGGLTGALNLAAAGSLDVGEAAEIAASALTQFKLSGNQTTHVADLLAAGAGKAQGSVHDMGAALNQSGLVASQMGLSIEETVGSLTAFAKAGLTGSDAGTSFRAMLLRLANPTQESAAKMQELGIDVYDAQGSFIGMEALAGQLQDRLGGLTQETRTQALAQIFGQDAIRTSAILYEQGAEGIAQWTAAVDDSGYAAEVAATRMDNLKGDLEQLSGSLETALIGLGSGANGPLRALVQNLTDVVNEFGELPGWIQQGTLALVGGSGLVLLGIAGLGKLAIFIAEAGKAMTDLKISSAAVKGNLLRLGAVGAALGLATVLLKVADAAQTASVSAEELQNRLAALKGGVAGVDAVFSDIGQGWADNLSTLSFDVGATSADDFRASLKLLDDSLDGGPIGDFSKMLNDIVGTDGGLRQFGIRVRQIGGELGSLASSDLPRAQEQFNRLVDAAGGGEEVVAQLVNQMPAYRDALYAAATAQGVTLDETTLLAAATGELALGAEVAATSATTLADEIQYVGQTTEEATKALEDWRAMVAESDADFISLTDGYQSVIDANTAWAQSTADATESSDDSWQTYYDGVTVSAADFISQLQAQVDAQTAWETNMTALTTKAREGMTTEMATAADEMIAELLDLGPEGAAQVALMASMTDTEFQTVVTLWGQKGTAATDAFVDSVETHDPPVIPLIVETASAYSVIDSFRREAGRTIYVNVAGQDVGFSTGTGRTQGRAGGGEISGPGTSTSDSVMARLSNGEHVLTASEVGMAGGQAAVYRMRAAIRAGVLRGFAGGGEVKGYAGGGGVYAQHQYAGAPQWSAPASAEGRIGEGAKIYVTTSDPLGAATAVVRRLNDGWV